MRLIAASILAVLAAIPVPMAAAQQLSPLTGTTAAPPDTTRPAAPAGTTANPMQDGGGRHHRMTAKQRFDAANTTHDGKLTLDQAKAGRMVRVARNFDAIDAGHKGYVTMADIQGYNRAQRAARKAAKQ